MTVIKQIVFTAALGMLSISMSAQNKYALLIGINDYYEVRGIKSDECCLHGSVNDANSIKDLLIAKFGFKKSNIDTIYNAEATRDNIIEGLKKKLKQCKQGDAMVFYYSGHGVYLYNADEKQDSVKRGMNQAMLMSDLYNYDNHLKCFFRDFALKQYFNLFIDKKILLTTIFDCCFSGKLSMGARGGDPSQQTKSVDLQALFGRLTQNAENPQMIFDSITGMSTAITKSCEVDSTGAIKDKLDSDGDGVPDCRDKQRFTDKQCFPVDQDGVGTCPFNYTLNVLGATAGKYDSAEFKKLNAIEHPDVEEKAFNFSAVLNISEKDTIRRPVDRKNSKFLFLSATTDLQKAVEFNDENGVRHSLFTASLNRVFQKNPADISVENLFQKIMDDMNGYHRDQTPTLYSDPVRKKNNLLGVKLQKMKK